MSYQTINWKVQNNVATLTLDRTDKLNAVNNQMCDEIYEAISKVQDDNNIKALIITGKGRAFCSGADIKERFLEKLDKRRKGELWDDVIHSFTEKTCLALTKIAKPTIAAINGMAFGLGSTIMLACDIRIASEKAKIGYGFVRMGVTPEFGSSFFLPRLVGLGRACELILTGKTIDAGEAYQIGLVNQVTPEETLMDTAGKLAANLSKSPPIAIQLAKQLLYHGLSADLATQVRFESIALDTSRRSQDHEEASKAFLEKRKPVFTGK